MAINKVVFGQQTLVDLTADTVTAEHLENGYTAHGADGNPIVGTMQGGGGGLNVRFGTFTPSGNLSQRQTITHNLGVVPNTVIFFDLSGTAHSTNNAVFFNAMILGYGGVRCFQYSSRLTTSKLSASGVRKYWGTGGTNPDCCTAIQESTFQTPIYLGGGHEYAWIVMADALT